jgi:hypothetical protein
MQFYCGNAVFAAGAVLRHPCCVGVTNVGIVLSSGSPIVGIMLSPSQVVPHCEEITTILSYIQVFIVCDTECIQVNFVGSCLK